MKSNVYILDSHPIVAEGLKKMTAQAGDVTTVGQAGRPSARELLMEAVRWVEK